MRPVQDFSLDEFEPFDDGPSRLARVRRALSTAIGACVAVALLLAVGVWFYRLGVRDAENVPIIRASAEPAKTRPEDPGGAVAPHQDITSYRVAESKPAQAMAAVIAPPPPEPKREDVAMGALPPEPVERPTAPEAASAPAAPVREAPATAPQPAEPTPAEAAAAIASGEVRARSQASGTEPQPAPAGAEALADAPVDAAVDFPAGEAVLALAEPAETALEQDAGPVDPVPNASQYAPPLTPPARPRPPDLKARMAAAVVAAEQSASNLARRAAESAVQVQLAADPSEDVVRTMWRRISQANSDLLHDRELAVQTTISGGTKFYRLRVGPFGGVSEARAVCQALKARGQDCIVARNG